MMKPGKAALFLLPCFPYLWSHAVLFGTPSPAPKWFRKPIEAHFAAGISGSWNPSSESIRYGTMKGGVPVAYTLFLKPLSFSFNQGHALKVGAVFRGRIYDQPSLFTQGGVGAGLFYQHPFFECLFNPMAQTPVPHSFDLSFRFPKLPRFLSGLQGVIHPQAFYAEKAGEKDGRKVSIYPFSLAPVLSLGRNGFLRGMVNLSPETLFNQAIPSLEVTLGLKVSGEDSSSLLLGLLPNSFLSPYGSQDLPKAASVGIEGNEREALESTEVEEVLPELTEETTPLSPAVQLPAVPSQPPASNSPKVTPNLGTGKLPGVSAVASPVTPVTAPSGGSNSSAQPPKQPKNSVGSSKAGRVMSARSPAPATQPQSGNRGSKTKPALEPKGRRAPQNLLDGNKVVEPGLMTKRGYNESESKGEAWAYTAALSGNLTPPSRQLGSHSRPATESTYGSGPSVTLGGGTGGFTKDSPLTLKSFEGLSGEEDGASETYGSCGGRSSSRKRSGEGTGLNDGGLSNPLGSASNRALNSSSGLYVPNLDEEKHHDPFGGGASVGSGRRTENEFEKEGDRGSDTYSSPAGIYNAAMLCREPLLGHFKPRIKCGPGCDSQSSEEGSLEEEGTLGGHDKETLPSENKVSAQLKRENSLLLAQQQGEAKGGAGKFSGRTSSLVEGEGRAVLLAPTGGTTLQSPSERLRAVPSQPPASNPLKVAPNLGSVERPGMSAMALPPMPLRPVNQQQNGVGGAGNGVIPSHKGLQQGSSLRQNITLDTGSATQSSRGPFKNTGRFQGDQSLQASRLNLGLSTQSGLGTSSGNLPSGLYAQDQGIVQGSCTGINKFEHRASSPSSTSTSLDRMHASGRGGVVLITDGSSSGGQVDLAQQRRLPEKSIDTLRVEWRNKYLGLWTAARNGLLSLKSYFKDSLFEELLESIRNLPLRKPSVCLSDVGQDYFSRTVEVMLDLMVRWKEEALKVIKHAPSPVGAPKTPMDYKPLVEICARLKRACEDAVRGDFLGSMWDLEEKNFEDVIFETGIGGAYKLAHILDEVSISGNSELADKLKQISLGSKLKREGRAFSKRGERTEEVESSPVQGRNGHPDRITLGRRTQTVPPPVEVGAAPRLVGCVSSSVVIQQTETPPKASPNKQGGEFKSPKRCPEYVASREEEFEFLRKYSENATLLKQIEKVDLLRIKKGIQAFKAIFQEVTTTSKQAKPREDGGVLGNWETVLRAKAGFCTVNQKEKISEGLGKVHRLLDSWEVARDDILNSETEAKGIEFKKEKLRDILTVCSELKVSCMTVGKLMGIWTQKGQGFKSFAHDFSLEKAYKLARLLEYRSTPTKELETIVGNIVGNAHLKEDASPANKKPEAQVPALKAGTVSEDGVNSTVNVHDSQRQTTRLSLPLSVEGKAGQASLLNDGDLLKPVKQDLSRDKLRGANGVASKGRKLTHIEKEKGTGTDLEQKARGDSSTSVSPGALGTTQTTTIASRGEGEVGTRPILNKKVSNRSVVAGVSSADRRKKIREETKQKYQGGGSGQFETSTEEELQPTDPRLSLQSDLFLEEEDRRRSPEENEGAAAAGTSATTLPTMHVVASDRKLSQLLSSEGVDGGSSDSNEKDELMSVTHREDDNSSGLTATAGLKAFRPLLPSESGNAASARYEHIRAPLTQDTYDIYNRIRQALMAPPGSKFVEFKYTLMSRDEVLRNFVVCLDSKKPGSIEVQLGGLPLTKQAQEGLVEALSKEPSRRLRLHVKLKQALELVRSFKTEIYSNNWNYLKTDTDIGEKPKDLEPPIKLIRLFKEACEGAAKEVGGWDLDEEILNQFLLRSGIARIHGTAQFLLLGESCPVVPEGFLEALKRSMSYENKASEKATVSSENVEVAHLSAPSLPSSKGAETASHEGLSLESYKAKVKCLAGWMTADTSSISRITDFFNTYLTAVTPKGLAPPALNDFPEFKKVSNVLMKEEDPVTSSSSVKSIGKLLVVWKQSRDKLVNGSCSDLATLIAPLISICSQLKSECEAAAKKVSKLGLAREVTKDALSKFLILEAYKLACRLDEGEEPSVDALLLRSNNTIGIVREGSVEDQEAGTGFERTSGKKSEVSCAPVGENEEQPSKPVGVSSPSSSSSLPDSQTGGGGVFQAPALPTAPLTKENGGQVETISAEGEAPNASVTPTTKEGNPGPITEEVKEVGAETAIIREESKQKDQGGEGNQVKRQPEETETSENGSAASGTPSSAGDGGTASARYEDIRAPLTGDTSDIYDRIRKVLMARSDSKLFEFKLSLMSRDQDLSNFVFSLDPKKKPGSIEAQLGGLLFTKQAQEGLVEALSKDRSRRACLLEKLKQATELVTSFKMEAYRDCWNLLETDTDIGKKPKDLEPLIKPIQSFKEACEGVAKEVGGWDLDEEILNQFLLKSGIAHIHGTAQFLLLGESCGVGPEGFLEALKRSISYKNKASEKATVDSEKVEVAQPSAPSLSSSPRAPKDAGEVSEGESDGKAVVSHSCSSLQSGSSLEEENRGGKPLKEADLPSFYAELPFFCEDAGTIAELFCEKKDKGSNQGAGCRTEGFQAPEEDPSSREESLEGSQLDRPSIPSPNSSSSKTISPPSDVPHLLQTADASRISEAEDKKMAFERRADSFDSESDEEMETDGPKSEGVSAAGSDSHLGSSRGTIEEGGEQTRGSAEVASSGPTPDSQTGGGGVPEASVLPAAPPITKENEGQVETISAEGEAPNASVTPTTKEGNPGPITEEVKEPGAETALIPVESKQKDQDADGNQVKRQPEETEIPENDSAASGTPPPTAAGGTASTKGGVTQTPLMWKPSGTPSRARGAFLEAPSLINHRAFSILTNRNYSFEDVVSSLDPKVPWSPRGAACDYLSKKGYREGLAKVLGADSSKRTHLFEKLKEVFQSLEKCRKEDSAAGFFSRTPTREDIDEKLEHLKQRKPEIQRLKKACEGAAKELFGWGLNEEISKDFLNMSEIASIYGAAQFVLSESRDWSPDKFVEDLKRNIEGK